MTTGPASLSVLGDQINNTLDRGEAGRLMLQVKAALLVAGSVGWTKWVAANLERSERACQRCITAAREEAAREQRESLICPVDLVIAAQGALPAAPIVGKPTVDLPLAEATTQIVADIADTWNVADEPVGYPTTEPDVDPEANGGGAGNDVAPSPGEEKHELVDEQDLAEFDVAYREADEPATGDEDPAGIPRMPRPRTMLSRAQRGLLQAAKTPSVSSHPNPLSQSPHARRRSSLPFGWL